MSKNELTAGCDRDCPVAAVLNREHEYRQEILNTNGSVPDDEKIIRRLRKKCEWSDRAAEALLMLATYYGAHILRNALALANVLDIEDGECGL